MNFAIFAEELEYYQLTNEQMIQLYKKYVKMARKYRDADVDFDVSDYLIGFEEICEAFKRSGYRGEDITNLIIREMENLQNDSNLKLLILDSVSEEEKNNVLFNHTELMNQSARAIYAKTRLWKELDKEGSYDAFLRLSLSNIHEMYGLSFKELIEKYPLNHQAISSLVSRRKVKQIVEQGNNQKSKVKAL